MRITATRIATENDSAAVAELANAHELNVDTGNESGALRLYEKVGFKPESSWIQMHSAREKE